MTKSESVTISNENELKNMFSNKGGNKEKDLKANTMLEKMGFKDNELFEQEHDNMLCSLMDESVIIKIFSLTSKIPEENIKKTTLDIKIKPEFPIKTYNGYIIGYADLLAEFRLKDKEKIDVKFILCIEIKTKIESIGALLRQINTYKEYLNCIFYIVIAPNVNNNQRNVLKMSGIHLIDIKDIIN